MFLSIFIAIYIILLSAFPVHLAYPGHHCTDAVRSVIVVADLPNNTTLTEKDLSIVV